MNERLTSIVNNEPKDQIMKSTVVLPPPFFYSLIYLFFHLSLFPLSSKIQILELLSGYCGHPLLHPLLQPSWPCPSLGNTPNAELFQHSLLTQIITVLNSPFLSAPANTHLQGSLSNLDELLMASNNLI